MTPDDENRALFAEAVAHQQAGQTAEAEKAYRALLSRNPRVIPALNNLGLLLDAAGRHGEAEQSFRAALAVRPEYPEALNNLGAAIRHHRKYDEALECFRQALALQPTNVEALINRGDLLRELGRSAEAAESYLRANALRPTDHRIHKGLGQLLSQDGKQDEAIAELATAVRLKPDSLEMRFALLTELQAVCAWDRTAEEEQIILSGVRQGQGGINPFLLLSTSATPADQLKCGQLYAASAKVVGRARAVDPVPAQKVRLGYLSGDYREHPISYLIAAMIELHDRARFEVVGYSLGYDDKGAMRPRMERGFDRFVDLEKASDEEAAAAVARDNIDILIDVSGYTRYGRPRILALRPAPLQINYLAFPGTMGADFVDYIIADRDVVPDDQQAFYSEKVVYLPDCYQVNDNKRAIAERTPSRRECGLPDGAFVFCSFNRTLKITPIFFDIWMNLLKSVPGSVLWLMESNRAATVNLRREAQARGVDPSRLVFAPRVPLPEHLARHRQADLFLDTLPYGAHTTMSDALWVGLPAVTSLGDTFAGRVGASLLRATDLAELITTNLRDYEALALSLAADPARLRALRQKLIARVPHAALFDSAKYTWNIEKAYEHMTTLRRAGRPPESFSV